jgi:hypothetical protein
MQTTDSLQIDNSQNHPSEAATCLNEAVACGIEQHRLQMSLYITEIDFGNYLLRKVYGGVI